jgi:hypothetical protein
MAVSTTSRLGDISTCSSREQTETMPCTQQPEHPSSGAMLAVLVAAWREKIPPSFCRIHTRSYHVGQTPTCGSRPAMASGSTKIHSKFSPPDERLWWPIT